MEATKSKLCRGVATVALLGILASCASPSTTSNGVTVSELPDSNSDALIEVARTAETEGDQETALSLYQRAAQAAPGKLEPLLAAGRVAAANGQHEEAARAYQLAVQNGPKNMDARYGLGRALAAQDLPNAAIKHFEAMLQVNRGDPRAYNGLGIAYDLLGDHRQAQSNYRTGLSIDPEGISLTNNLAYSLILSGDHEEAAHLLEQVVEKPFATQQTHRNLALAYNLMGRQEESRAVVLGSEGVDDMAQAVTSYQANVGPAKSVSGSQPQSLSSSQAGGALSAASVAPTAAADAIPQSNNGPATATAVEENSSFELDPVDEAPQSDTIYRRQDEPADVTPRYVSAPATPAVDPPAMEALAPDQTSDQASEQTSGPATIDPAEELPNSAASKAELTAEPAAEANAELTSEPVAKAEPQSTLSGLEAQAAVKRPSTEERRMVSYEQSDTQSVSYSLNDVPEPRDRVAEQDITETPALEQQFLNND